MLYNSATYLTETEILRGPNLAFGDFDAAAATQPELTIAHLNLWNWKHAGLCPAHAPGYFAARKSTRDSTSIFYATHDTFDTYEALSIPASIAPGHSGYADISVGFWQGAIGNPTDPKWFVFRSNKNLFSTPLAIAAYDPDGLDWHDLTGDWNSKFGTNVFKRDDMTATLGAFSFFFGEEV